MPALYFRGVRRSRVLRIPSFPSSRSISLLRIYQLLRSFYFPPLAASRGATQVGPVRVPALPHRLGPAGAGSQLPTPAEVAQQPGAGARARLLAEAPQWRRGETLELEEVLGFISGLSL